MANGSGFVDTSGSMPRLKVGALIAAAMGSVLWGYWAGLLRFIDAIGSGLSDAVGGLAAWLSDDVVGGVAGLGVDVLDAAWSANAAWVASTFGPLAPVVAVAEFALIGWLLLATFSAIGRRWRA